VFSDFNVIGLSSFGCIVAKFAGFSQDVVDFCVWLGFCWLV